MSRESDFIILESKLEDKLPLHEQEVYKIQTNRVQKPNPDRGFTTQVYGSLKLLRAITESLDADTIEAIKIRGTINVAGDYPAAGDREDQDAYIVTGIMVTDPVTSNTYYRDDLIIWYSNRWYRYGEALENPLTPKGSINVNTDFPLLAEVQIGWLYYVLSDVTDNAGAPYTNTGQSFSAGDEIFWNGTVWVNLGPATFVASAVTYDNSTSGLAATDVQAAIDELKGIADTHEAPVRAIKVTVGTAATTDSTQQLPSGSEVVKSVTHIGTAYDNSADITVGIAGDTAKFQEAADIDPAEANSRWIADQNTAVGGADAAVRVTVTNSPTVGSATVYVFYTTPQT